MNSVRELLEEVFGEAETAVVLTSPSRLTAEQAREIVEALPLDGILINLGMLAAQEVANGFEAFGLRPADYALIEGLPDLLRKRLADTLGKDPQPFLEAYMAQLSARG
jgi:hypothetical protein